MSQSRSIVLVLTDVKHIRSFIRKSISILQKKKPNIQTNIFSKKTILTLFSKANNSHSFYSLFFKSVQAFMLEEKFLVEI